MSVTLLVEDGDWVLQSDGTFDTVSGYRKGVQDLAESLKNNYDEEDPSWFNGSTIYKIGENMQVTVESGIGPEMQLRTAVEDSVFRLMELQNEDEYVDDAERITEIRNLMVRGIGRSTYFFYLLCINDLDQEITERFQLKLLPKIPPGLSETLSAGTELRRDIVKSFI